MKNLSLPLSLCAIFFLFFAGVTGDNKPNQFDCVGTVLKNSGVENSCVLVSSQYVLLMADDLIDMKTKMEPLPGTNVLANNPYDRKLTDLNNIQIMFQGKTYDCEKFILYPEFVSDSLKGYCNIALIKLKEEVKGITPAIINTDFDEMHDKVIGTGNSASDNSGKAQKLIDSLGGYQLNNSPIMLICKFKNHSFNNINEWVKNDILFSQKDNELQLTGIGGGVEYKIGKTVKDNPDKTAMCWTRVAVFANWIKKNTTE